LKLEVLKIGRTNLKSGLKISEIFNLKIKYFPQKKKEKKVRDESFF
jgi:hypothetical protein